MLERVLIVGYGSIGKRHLRIARETLPNADIRVLRHQSFSGSIELADGCFSDLEQARSYRPQAAVIANPAPFHIATALALAGAHTHLLVEKPLSTDSSGAQALIRTMRDRGLILQVGYNLRFTPSLGRFRELLQTGAIGRVLSVRCEVGQYLPSWRPDVDYRQTVSARRELGGGALLELSHELDYLRWIFGDVAWLNAWVGKQSELEIDVEDTAHLVLGFGSDKGGKQFVGALSLDFVRHDTTRVCIAIGDRGSLRWNGVSGEVEERAAGATGWRSVLRHTAEKDESYRAQWLAFMECIRSCVAPIVTGEDGLAVLNLIEAAHESARSRGARVDVRN